MFERIVSELARINWFGLVPFLTTWFIFFSAATLSYLYQAWRHRKRFGFVSFLGHTFPLSGWKSRSALGDVAIYVIAHLTLRGLAGRIGNVITITLATLLAALLAQAFPDYVPQTPTVLALVVMSIIIFFFRDFANFLAHYCQHKIPSLWEFHKVHHSAQFLSPITRERMHPVDDQFNNAVVSLLISAPIGICVFLFKLTILETLLFSIFPVLIGNAVVLESLRHSQFPVSFGRFDRILVSPHMHHLHHSSKVAHWDRNFGQHLSIWDWMFGTAIIPDKNETLIYGIGRGSAVDQEFNGLYGIYVKPVIRAVRVLVDPSLRERRPETAVAKDLALESDKKEGRRPIKVIAAESH